MGNILKFIRMFLFPEITQKLEYERCTDEKPKNFILVFDIDYCLYTSESCLKAENEHIRILEEALFNEWNNNPENNKVSPKSIKELKREFGSIIEGISSFYKKDMDYFIKQGFYDAYEYVERDEELIKTLRELPFDKYCFTNGFQKRADPILKKMAIKKFFKGVFCPDEKVFRNQSRIAKPKIESYRFVEYYLKPDKNTRIVFFDDAEENIKIAESEEFQWICYLVTPETNIHSRIKEFKEKYLKHE